VKTLRLLMVAGIVLSVAVMAWSQAAGPVGGAAAGAASRPASMPTSANAGMAGTLVKVEGMNIVYRPMQRGGAGQETSFTTTAKTVFVVDGESGKLADLKPEMTVFIISTPDKVQVMANTRGVYGTVVKVEGKNVVISVRQRGGEQNELTIATDAKTKIITQPAGAAGGETPGQAKFGTLEDLKAGTMVTATPETGTATKIIVGTARRGGRGASRPASMPAM
jgi:hypothetical protein